MARLIAFLFFLTLVLTTLPSTAHAAAGDITIIAQTAAPALQVGTSSQTAQTDVNSPEEELKEYSPKTSYWLFLIPIALIFLAIFFG